MPRILPSQAIEFIATTLGKYIQLPEGAGNMFTHKNQHQLVALIEIVDHIPTELIVLEGDDFIKYISSVAAIRHGLDTWKTNLNWTLNYVPGLPQLNPVRFIYDALQKCPNDVPIAGASPIAFITDPEFNERLRLDIGSVHHALSNGDWKAATVLAGSIIEALLLWALEQKTDLEVTSAIQKLVAAKTISKPDNNHEKWTLYVFAHVTAELQLIKKDTFTLANLTREYRDLIHPGRAQRLKQKCDRSTAYTAIAALDRIVDDLTESLKSP